MSVCSTYDHISFDSGIGYLAYNILVCKTYDKTIFRSIVFVFVLSCQTFTSIVISFSFSSPLEFDLKSLKVGLVFDDFDETLQTCKKKPSIKNLHKSFQSLKFRLKILSYSIHYSFYRLLFKKFR